VFLYLRLLLIVALVVLAVWFVRRLYLASARNPYLRYYLSNISGLVIRVFLIRYLLTFLLRAVRLLRFFR
jgi:flagellar biogenesis protein FliO